MLPLHVFSLLVFPSISPLDIELNETSYSAQKSLVRYCHPRTFKFFFKTKIEIFGESSVHKCSLGVRGWILSSITPPIVPNNP